MDPGPFGRLSKVTTVSFTLPFTPKIKPVFKCSLTDTEHLMEFAAFNQRMLVLWLYFGRQKGRGSQSAQATDITVRGFFVCVVFECLGFFIIFFILFFFISKQR